VSWPFAYPPPERLVPPSLADSARVMAEHRCLNDRARYRARAALMREAMGLPRWQG